MIKIMTIRALNLTFRANTPILITEKDVSTSNYTTTLDYIPGSSVFGAIGYNYLKSLQKDPKYERISQVFTKGYVKGYGSISEEAKPIYDNLTKIEGNEKLTDDFFLNVSDFLPTQENSSRKTPPLMSIMKCRADKEHLSDGTLFLIKNILKHENQKGDLKVIKPALCPIDNCSNNLKKSAESCYLREGKIKSGVVEKNPKLGIAIDAKNRSNQMSMLFNQEFISRDQSFSGTILFDDSRVDSGKLLEACKKIYVGNRKNVGFGCLELVNANEKDFATTIESMSKSLIERYRKNKKVQDEYLKGLNDSLENKLIIPFYLESNISKSGVEILKTIVEKHGTVEIRFLQSKTKIWRLRTEYNKDWIYEPVIERGSVGYIQVTINQNTESEISSIFQDLANIEIHRVGTLRLKGLGQFHFFPDIFYNLSNMIK